MNLKEAVLFVYGIIFATSTPYLKPRKRFQFPTATWKFDVEHFGSSLTLFLGGSGACAHLQSKDVSVVVNTNIGLAAEQWRGDIISLGIRPSAFVILNSLNGSFGDAGTVRALGSIDVVFVYADEDKGLQTFADLPVNNIDCETVLQIGEETIRLIPVSGCANERDLVVFFEKRSIMMFGSLFMNRIHPHLKLGVSLRTQNWIATLQMLTAKFNPNICVPGEGDVGRIDDVYEFIRYLKALTDPAIEFSFCRQNFDWMEIPSTSSLEENFDILRRNVKTHTSIR